MRQGTVQIARTPTPPLPMCVATSVFLGAGKLQGLTSKSKVQHRNQNVSRTPSKNHRTPHSCDEEKQWRLQNQHHFPPFFSSRLCPFASPTLRNAVKETSSGITAGRCIHNSIFFFRFFRLAVTSSCPVNALPETKCAAGYCFAEGLERVTKSHC